MRGWIYPWAIKAVIIYAVGLLTFPPFASNYGANDRIGHYFLLEPPSDGSVDVTHLIFLLIWGVVVIAAASYLWARRRSQQDLGQ